MLWFWLSLSVHLKMEFYGIVFIAFNVLSSIKLSASHCGKLYLTWSRMSLCLLLERIGSCLPLRTACFHWKLHQKMDSPMLMCDFLSLLFCWLDSAFADCIMQIRVYKNSLYYTVNDSYFCWMQISFQPLVQCLDVDNLLKLFTAVLLERRILLRSNKYFSEPLTANNCLREVKKYNYHWFDSLYYSHYVESFQKLYRICLHAYWNLCIGFIGLFRHHHLFNFSFFLIMFW